MKNEKEYFEMLLAKKGPLSTVDMQELKRKILRERMNLDGLTNEDEIKFLDRLTDKWLAERARPELPTPMQTTITEDEFLNEYHKAKTIESSKDVRWWLNRLMMNLDIKHSNISHINYQKSWSVTDKGDVMYPSRIYYITFEGDTFNAYDFISSKYEDWLTKNDEYV